MAWLDAPRCATGGAPRQGERRRPKRACAPLDGLQQASLVAWLGLACCSKQRGVTTAHGCGPPGRIAPPGALPAESKARRDSNDMDGLEIEQVRPAAGSHCVQQAHSKHVDRGWTGAPLELMDRGDFRLDDPDSCHAKRVGNDLLASNAGCRADQPLNFAPKPPFPSTPITRRWVARVAAT